MTQQLFILTGASRGMGLAMAQQLLRDGNTVICISRTMNESLARETVKTNGTLILWMQDLAHGAQASARLVQWLQDQGTDAFASSALINNAAVIPRIGPLREADTDDLTQALRVGLEAPMLLTAAFLRATTNWTGIRKVLNISSGLGRRAMASQAAYCATKAGMDHFTRCLALDEALKANGAKVCSLAPGVIDTDMQAQLRSAQGDAFPDHSNFINLKTSGSLTSPQEAAKRVLAVLMRADFGLNPVADVRD